MKRSSETVSSPKNMLRLVGDGEVENGRALSVYGPLKVGLITTQETQIAQLKESLSCLERKVSELNSKYCAAYVTLMDVMDHLAKLCAIIKESGTIDEEDE